MSKMKQAKVEVALLVLPAMFQSPPGETKKENRLTQTLLVNCVSSMIRVSSTSSLSPLIDDTKRKSSTMLLSDRIRMSLLFMMSAGSLKKRRP